MTVARAYLVAAAFGVLALAGFGGWRAYRAHAAALHLQKADVLDTSQATHGAKAETHEQEATAITPKLQADDAAVAADRAALARLAVHRPGPAANPETPAGDPVPHPDQAPVVLAALDAAKDTLISDLTKQVEDLKASNAALAQADQERQAQVKDLKGEVVQLRASIAAMPKDLHWGVSIAYGTSQTAGAGVEYSRNIFFGGVDVVRRQVAGGQTTIEALGHIGVRF